MTGPESDQTLSDIDQTRSESDQTLSGVDQTSSDRDRTSSESDQIASDRDQAASDRDLAAGVDPREHQITKDIRQRATEQRELSAQARLDAANDRHAAANARDLAALARDQAAAARDRAMAQKDAAHSQAGSRADFGAEIILRAAEQRRRAAEYRVLAAEQRELAAADRLAAAWDREQAARERARSLEDLQTLAAQLSVAETDPLTGARMRAAGLADLDRELKRCRRTGNAFVVAYVDVVGLKELNDTLGHWAGDDLLRDVVELIREHLRSYDLIVRMGGDEFVCAVSDMLELHVRARFDAVGDALLARPHPCAIRTGLATLRDDEQATDLIARADAELIRSPRPMRPSRTPGETSPVTHGT